MTQDAIVLKAFDNGLAEVLVARGTSCGEHCGSCGVCKYVGEIHTYAKNKIHAVPGDKVVIVTNGNTGFYPYLTTGIVLSFDCDTRVTIQDKNGRVETKLYDQVYPI